MWQTRLLAEWHPLFLSLPLESVIRDNQQGYYHALAQSDGQAECAPFILFMLEAIEDTLVKNAPASAPANAPVNLKGLKTPQAIMACIQQDNSVTRLEMAERIGKDIRTIARAIKRLQEAGRLKRVGSDKTGHWEIIDG